MTTIAARTKISIMDIVRTVAINAGPRCGLDDLHRLTMATVTMYISMLAIQFELRLGIMIKPPDLPAIRGMTTIAVQSQFSLMRIVFLMTRVTIQRGILV